MNKIFLTQMSPFFEKWAHGNLRIIQTINCKIPGAHFSKNGLICVKNDFTIESSNKSSMSKEFSCRYCGNGFSRRRHMVRHIETSKKCIKNRETKTLEDIIDERVRVVIKERGLDSPCIQNITNNNNSVVNNTVNVYLTVDPDAIRHSIEQASVSELQTAAQIANYVVTKIIPGSLRCADYSRRVVKWEAEDGREKNDPGCQELMDSIFIEKNSEGNNFADVKGYECLDKLQSDYNAREDIDDFILDQHMKERGDVFKWKTEWKAGVNGDGKLRKKLPKEICQRVR
jgi:ribosomal protein S26